VTVAAAAASHWISVVVRLGVWSTGAAVVDDDAADAVFDVDVDPLGTALSRLVGGQPDVFAPLTVDDAALALRITGREWRHGELVAAAAAGAQSHHLDGTARVLSTLALDTVDGIDAGLLVPLAAGASVVLVTNVDSDRLAETAAAEHVTHTAGARVDGLPRLGQ
jgi:hypothetical protein